MFSAAEVRAMERAIELALLGGKRVFPNPMVGAVILDHGGTKVAEGFHACCGAPHAESIALSSLNSARGCTMVVSLEPCCHHGRTPPCTDALIQSGIRRVVAATQDPNPLVAGRGIETLRNAGIEVEAGLLRDRAEAVNSTYFHYRKTGRSLLHLKMAATLDGRAAAADGSSRWITGLQARKRVHLLRSEAHAVLVGAGTAIQDDPLLTAREGDTDLPPDHQPVRIIFAKKPLPENLRVFNTPGETFVASPERIPVPPSATAWPGVRTLEELLQLTASKGLGLILCEGGPSLAASLIRNHLVDRLSIFTAPALIGGNGRPVIEGFGAESMADALRLTDVSVTPVGEDILTEGRIVYRAD